MACNQQPKKELSTLDQGKNIFRQNCVICHGVQGNLGTNGAFDLSISALSVNQKIVVITLGRNTMTAFGKTLSESEIRTVAEYTELLKSGN